MRDTGQSGVIFDPLVDRGFCDAILEAIAGRRRLKGLEGDLLAHSTREFRRILGSAEGPLEPSAVKAEQSNTSVAYGDRFILKLFRRLAEGVNPDLELGRLLTERGFRHTPPVAGFLEYRRPKADTMTVAVLQGFVPNEGDAWRYTMDALGHYFEQVLASDAEVQPAPRSTSRLLELAEQDPPLQALETIGNYLDSARLLGKRTGEMHLALASDPDHPDFAPEPFSTLYQRSIYQSMRSLAAIVFQTLRQGLRGLPEELQRDAESILRREGEILQRLQSIVERKITATRIRCHGDYHLGQVLYTGKDFVIIDFEGEPARPLSERRIKRSPLRDVAGMLRSFHYASNAALYGEVSGVVVRPEDIRPLMAWARFWRSWVSASFLGSYLEVTSHASFLPRTRDELHVLLDAFLVEKAIYELGYELNNRPAWVAIPIRGILQLLE